MSGRFDPKRHIRYAWESSAQPFFIAPVRSLEAVESLSAGEKTMLRISRPRFRYRADDLGEEPVATGPERYFRQQPLNPQIRSRTVNG
jgi:hypothetical protein